MKPMHTVWIGIGSVALAMAGGCAGSQVMRESPAARPLGSELPAFHAPQEPPAAGRPPSPAAAASATAEAAAAAAAVEATAAAAAAAGAAAPVATTAPPAAGTARLTLREALSRALLHNPELAAFSWEVRARDAEVLQAGLRPNPELAVEVENFAGSGEFGGLGAAETTISLAQLVQLGGKRARRQALAGLDRDLAVWDYEERRLDVFTAVTKAFVEVLAAQRRLALAEDLIGVAERTLDSVARRVDAGAVTPVELSRARVELATSRIERRRAARSLAAARARLAATWGADTVSFGEAEGRLETAPRIPALEALLAGIEQSPEVARWTTEVEQRRADLALQRALRIPDLSVGGGVRRLSESSDAALVLELALPLPLLDRNQGAARAANHRVAAALEQLRGARVRVGATLAAAYEELAAAAEEVEALEDTIIPEATTAQQTAEDAYNRGLFRLTDVLDTQRTLFELRGRYFAALAGYHTSAADIERLLGAPITGQQPENGGP